jgi:hypothetical protein
MPLPDHHRPLSEHERRALAEIEATFDSEARSRRHRLRLLLWSSVIAALAIAEAVVIALAVVGGLAGTVAVPFAGLAGTLLGALAVRAFALRPV